MAAALLLSACSGGRGYSALPPGAASIVRGAAGDAATGKIKHIVIIVQENRSFNNLFYGFPGARTQTYGYNTKGKKIALKPLGLETTWDLDHSSYSFFSACNGTGRYPGTDCRMNGFNKEVWYCGHSSQPPCPNSDPPYSYVPNSETKPYFYLGRKYVLADEMYASNFDASSFVSHQYIIAGQANFTVNFPYEDWGCEGGYADDIDTISFTRQIGSPIQACFNSPTLGDEMDAAGLSWAFYSTKITGSGGFWSAYQAIKHIYDGPDWKKDVITPPTRFFTDVAKGKLRDLSWITPTCRNSDHAGCGAKTGPSWVASLVNSIGESKYWDSTAIFIFWDDYGGWYDPAPPKMLDYDGLGLRIPMLIVSAYAKEGRVSHVHYEHGSILKFVEDEFGLHWLAASDHRSNSPDDAFNFTQSPRKFVPIQAPYGKNYFLHQPPDPRPPDTN